ncbi:glycosyltransferase family 2 protein [Agromyces sp. SYSU K20354]|uniref:glycosyltransferase family A protein n=1 Tax=Agromyces cavernae TaxID=2898659 RepID=UPI001E4980ED|nr:glycosyltransferase family A protein [Agromyces cavernae]MCD2444060.1 glycosyltransferase family 2 protein [Agromyces cavernae]
MPATEVDVVIAVHDPRRAIARAVGSVLTSSGVARVLVVCHNTPVDGIAAGLGRIADDRRVRLEPFDDGIGSPAGPFNRGLELATARFTAIMGSDDELAEGAIDAWIATADRHGADVVIPAMRYAGGRRVPTPPTRPGRATRLDGVRDRLAYRTAPIGLVARERFGALRFTPGLATGEDLAYSTRLWFSGAGIARVGSGAEYVIHDDAVRVTFTHRPIEDELAAVTGLVSDEWVTALPSRSREALAVKLWRISVFGAVHHRSGNWTPDDRRALAAVADAIEGLAPGAVAVLSRAELALRRAIADPTASDDDLDARSRARRRFATPASLIPANPLRVAAREAPLRFAFATWLAGREGGRVAKPEAGPTL